jgi:gliding motility-associated lipoprotein GldD
MYPRIEWPTRVDTALREDYCSFTFQYPDYFAYSKNATFFDEKPIHPCWFNLNSKALNCTMHWSYYPIDKKNTFDSLRQDAFALAGKHNIKAEYRKESLIENGEIKGLIFEIDGPVACPIQFYITDEKKHFVRASLYFNAKVNPDSTKVVYDFIKEDILKMIESIEWKKK